VTLKGGVAGSISSIEPKRYEEIYLNAGTAKEIDHFVDNDNPFSFDVKVFFGRNVGTATLYRGKTILANHGVKISNEVIKRWAEVYEICIE